MEEQLISFETAKLAKEKGFGENPYLQLYTYYDLKGKLYNEEDCIGTTIGESSEYSWSNSVSRDSVEAYISGMDYSLDEYVLAPTQSLLQKWLRETYNILVETQFDTVSFGYRIFNPFKTTDYFTEWKYKTWDFEEALEEGLYQALLLLPDKE